MRSAEVDKKGAEDLFHQKYVLKTSHGICIKLKMSLLAAMPSIKSSTEPKLVTHCTEDHFGMIIL